MTGSHPTQSGKVDVDAARLKDCERAWAYMTDAGLVKVILGNPVLGAVGVEWALSPESARTLRDHLSKALDD